MAKITNLLGSISGRIGGIVYSKGEKSGISYMRSWQPQVLNPKTEGQTDQRVKVLLCGKVSGVTPKELLVGLGTSNRKRRSEFMKNLIIAATVDRSQPGTVVAKLAPEAIVFSKGSETLRAAASSASITANAVTVKLTLNDASYANRYGERIVVAIVDPEQKGGYSAVVYQDALLTSTEEQTITIPTPNQLTDETLVCIYRIPWVLNEQGVAATKSDLYNDGTLILASIVENSSNIRDYGASLLQVKQVFTAA